MIDSRADAWIETWIDALLVRHASALTRPELLKAFRALSARYVERRGELGRRSPIDSAGKRAAFAVFYAPLHFVTTWHVVQALGAARRAPATLLDLGCGTGAASAAWALAARGASPPALAGRATPRITGVDRDAWALGEARWTWKTLGLTGRTRRGDLVRALSPATSRGTGSTARRANRTSRPDAVIVAWTANELPPGDLVPLRDALLAAAGAGTTVLVLEPIARGAAPWWPDWASRFAAAGGRADDWAFDVALPGPLARLSAEAGFDRRQLKARSLFVPANRPPEPAC
jgi:hypothetical protein